MNESINFLNSILEKDDCIVLGISGGPDSMCLLHVLINLKNKLNLKLVCAHVNHGLREDCEIEKEYVKNYCKENDVIFEYHKITNYSKNKFSEEEGRKKRYTFFNELINKYNGKYLMTAHHGDDLVETILMRMVRGSNLNGYIGIPKISVNNKYKIVRPLLYITKENIINYLNDNNIKYFVDESNESEKYTRNRFRKQVLPFLKNEDKNVHLKFIKYSEELESYKNYINSIIEKKINDIYVNKRIIVNKLLEEDKFIQEKIIEYIIRDIQKNDIFNINDKGLENILNLLDTKDNKEINLANGYIVRRSYNYLYIEKNKNVDKYNYKLDKNIKILNKYNFEIITYSNLKTNNIMRLNTKEIKLPLYIRTKKDGDRIEIKNLKGSKKLKDIFINSKIDKKKRKEYPILVDSENTIIWIPGIKKSKFDKEINEFYDIIIKYTEEENE